MNPDISAISRLEESVRMQQQTIATQQEQLREQHELLKQYEINLQKVADQVSAQGMLVQAQARLYKLDRERAMKKRPAALRDTLPPTPTHDAAEVPEAEPPTVAHPDLDDDCMSDQPSAAPSLHSSGVDAGGAESRTGVEAPRSSKPGTQAEESGAGGAEPRTGVEAPPSSEPGTQAEEPTSPVDACCYSPTQSSSASSTASSGWTVMPSSYLESVLSAGSVMHHVLPYPPTMFLSAARPEITFFRPDFQEFRGWPHFAARPIQYPPAATNVELLAAGQKRKLGSIAEVGALESARREL